MFLILFLITSIITQDGIYEETYTFQYGSCTSEYFERKTWYSFTSGCLLYYNYYGSPNYKKYQYYSAENIINVIFDCYDTECTGGCSEYNVSIGECGFLGGMEDYVKYSIEDLSIVEPKEKEIAVSYYQTGVCSDVMVKMVYNNDVCAQDLLERFWRRKCIAPDTYKEILSSNSSEECYYGDISTNNDYATDTCIEFDSYSDLKFTTTFGYIEYNCGENATNYHSCFGEYGENTCSGSSKGVCVGENNCSCINNWGGRDCSLPTCNGLSNEDDGVCSNKGTCFDHDVCFCNDGYHISLDGGDCLDGVSNKGLSVVMYSGYQCEPYQYERNEWVRLDSCFTHVEDEEKGWFVIAANEYLYFIFCYNYNDDQKFDCSMRDDCHLGVKLDYASYINTCENEYILTSLNWQSDFKFMNFTYNFPPVFENMNRVTEAVFKPAGSCSIDDIVFYHQYDSDKCLEDESFNDYTNECVSKDQYITNHLDYCGEDPPQSISYHNITCSRTEFGGYNQSFICPEDGVYPIWCGDYEENNPLVCGGNGNCTSQDNCTCNYGFYGETCDKYFCFNKKDTNPDQCSGHGYCYSTDFCLCEKGYKFDGYSCVLISQIDEDMGMVTKYYNTLDDCDTDLNELGEWYFTVLADCRKTIGFNSYTTNMFYDNKKWNIYYQNNADCTGEPFDVNSNSLPEGCNSIETESGTVFYRLFSDHLPAIGKTGVLEEGYVLIRKFFTEFEGYPGNCIGSVGDDVLYYREDFCYGELKYRCNDTHVEEIKYSGGVCIDPYIDSAYQQGCFSEMNVGISSYDFRWDVKCYDSSSSSSSSEDTSEDDTSSTSSDDGSSDDGNEDNSFTTTISKLFIILIILIFS